jgi:anti-sigma factor RsiW
MVNCKQAVGALADYLEQAMTPETRADMLAHIHRCPACETFVETYRKTTALCRKALMKEAPPGLTERVMAFIKKHADDPPH